MIPSMVTTRGWRASAACPERRRTRSRFPPRVTVVGPAVPGVVVGRVGDLLEELGRGVRVTGSSCGQQGLSTLVIGEPGRYDEHLEHRPVGQRETGQVEVVVRQRADLHVTSGDGDAAWRPV